MWFGADRVGGGGGCFLLQRGVFCVSIFVYRFKMEIIR